jgi:hypothetical protein
MLRIYFVKKQKKGLLNYPVIQEILKSLCSLKICSYVYRSALSSIHCYEYAENTLSNACVMDEQHLERVRRTTNFRMDYAFPVLYLNPLELAKELSVLLRCFKLLLRVFLAFTCQFLVHLRFRAQGSSSLLWHGIRDETRPSRIKLSAKCCSHETQAKKTKLRLCPYTLNFLEQRLFEVFEVVLFSFNNLINIFTYVCYLLIL